MLENAQLSALLRSSFGLTVSLAISYFAMNWIRKSLDPSQKEKEKSKKKAKALLKDLKIKNLNLNDYELCIASDLINPQSLDIDWSCIGGLDSTVADIKESVLLPFIYRKHVSKLVRPPKGVLLHGPPGCGKTMLAKAMAKSSNANFINLQISSIMDKWYGESQKRVEAIFSLANKISPTIIFIDEVDSFLRTRSSKDHEASGTMKTQFMTLWDGLNSDPDNRIMIVGATNRMNDIDPAILRRMPANYYIGPPDAKARKLILSIILKEEKLALNVDIDRLSQITDNYTGSDLQELCRKAAIIRLGYANKDIDNADNNNEETEAIFEMSDFLQSLKKLPKKYHDINLS